MTFTDCPESTTPGLRFVGSSLMDEEQFRVEQWQYINGGWACDPEGIRRYAQLKEQRKQDRHNSWKARRDAEDAWSEQMVALIEEAK